MSLQVCVYCSQHCINRVLRAMRVPFKQKVMVPVILYRVVQKLLSPFRCLNLKQALAQAHGNITKHWHVKAEFDLAQREFHAVLAKCLSSASMLSKL